MVAYLLVPVAAFAVRLTTSAPGDLAVPDRGGDTGRRADPDVKQPAARA
jgi:hypothetical protein